MYKSPFTQCSTSASKPLILGGFMEDMPRITKYQIQIENRTEDDLHVDVVAKNKGGSNDGIIYASKTISKHSSQFLIKEKELLDRPMIRIWRNPTYNTGKVINADESIIFKICRPGRERDDEFWNFYIEDIKPNLWYGQTLRNAIFADPTHNLKVCSDMPQLKIGFQFKNDELIRLFKL